MGFIRLRLYYQIPGFVEGTSGPLDPNWRHASRLHVGTTKAKETWPQFARSTRCSVTMPDHGYSATSWRYIFSTKLKRRSCALFKNIQQPIGHLCPANWFGLWVPKLSIFSYRNIICGRSDRNLVILSIQISQLEGFGVPWATCIPDTRASASLHQYGRSSIALCATIENDRTWYHLAYNP